MKNIIQVISGDYIKEFISSQKYYGPKSLVVSIVDSVFSIGVKYESTIKVVERFCRHAGIDVNEDEYTLEEFLHNYGEYSYLDLAEKVFVNRQRTSTRNGILKAEAVVWYIRTLHEFGINTTKDLLEYPYIDSVRTEIIKIPGQRSGISFSYLMMLAGDVNLFKPDRHIYNFFENYLECGKLNELKLNRIFKDKFIELKNDFPNMTIRTLDNIIWKYMKHDTKTSMHITKTRNKLPYFMNNKAWYYFDEEKYKFYLTEYAPSKAEESYNRFYNY